MLAAALAPMARALAADYVAMVTPHEGAWSTISEAGKRLELPTELLFDALDRVAPQADGGWLAAPTRAHQADHEVLAAHFGARVPPAVQASFAALALLAGQAMRDVRQRQQLGRRARRLEAILEIAANWNKTHEM